MCPAPLSISCTYPAMTFRNKATGLKCDKHNAKVDYHFKVYMKCKQAVVGEGHQDGWFDL